MFLQCWLYCFLGLLPKLRNFDLGVCSLFEILALFKKIQKKSGKNCRIFFVPQKFWGKCAGIIPGKIPKKMSRKHSGKKVPEKFPLKMSRDNSGKNVPEKMSRKNSGKIVAEKMSRENSGKNVPEKGSRKIPEKMSERKWVHRGSSQNLKTTNF